MRTEAAASSICCSVGSTGKPSLFLRCYTAATDSFLSGMRMGPASSFQSSGSRRSTVETFAMFVACDTVCAGLIIARVGAVGAAVAAVDTMGDDTPPKGGAFALYF